MMKHSLRHIVLVQWIAVLGMCLSAWGSAAQSNALITHFTDLPWYYNPAQMMNRPSHLQAFLLHRSQWGELEVPTMNLAAMKVPVIFGIGKEHSHAIGAIAYQEDLGFLTRTLFELNVGGFVWEDGKNRLDVGGSFGM
ncbi:MAG: type IX secretion system membrane protein PorP/SprF, partial [Bacteroidota bacterium]